MTMIRKITTKDAKDALANYYLDVHGIALGRKSGIEIDHVEDGVIYYTDAKGDKKELIVSIETRYIYVKPLSGLPDEESK